MSIFSLKGAFRSFFVGTKSNEVELEIRALALAYRCFCGMTGNRNDSWLKRVVVNELFKEEFF